jgi:hypothetical protein
MKKYEELATLLFTCYFHAKRPAPYDGDRISSKEKLLMKIINLMQIKKFVSFLNGQKVLFFGSRFGREL